MKMWLLVLALFCANVGFSEELIFEDSAGIASIVDSEKYYIESDEIVVADKALFVIIGGQALSVAQINVDEQGLFVFLAAAVCGKGHQLKCNMCGGCSVWDCPCRCKCKR